MHDLTTTSRRFSLPDVGHGWAGLLLVAIFWPLNWLLPGLRTHILFFPLWLGYILAVDALVLHRRGTSLLHRSRRDFLLLFVLSAPAWWIFEVINWHTQNWQYHGRELIGNVEYVIFASVAFSTVMPAVFETAELVRSFDWVERFKRGPRIPASRRSYRVFLLGGLAMLALLVTWPRTFYPFVWGHLYLLIESVNGWLGRRTLLDDLQHGDWRPVASLAVGALICGVFWEMWNYYAYPKWTYDAPGANFWHVFEMPLLGFIGYLPFALELYALLHLVKKKESPLNL